VAQSTVAAEPPPGWQRRAAWVTLIGAGAAAVVSGGFVLWRYLEFTKFNDISCGTGEIEVDPREECRQRYRRGKNATTGAIASGIAAAALGVGAGALFLTLPAEAGRQTLSLRASPSYLGLRLQGRF